eukprot:scaffold241183_cov20-Tisochrysis_lutea.AAC.1
MHLSIRRPKSATIVGGVNFWHVAFFPLSLLPHPRLSPPLRTCLFLSLSASRSSVAREAEGERELGAASWRSPAERGA